MLIGVRVRIRRNSEFYGQCNEVGVVTENSDTVGYFKVEFSSGYRNSYRDTDLEMVGLENDEAVEGEMIDKKFIREAVNPSRIIREIEQKWKNRCSTLLSGVKRLPINGDYEAIVSGNYICVKGYEGNLVIKKMYYNRTTYSIMSTITIKDFKLYGRYSIDGDFNGFIGIPAIGCHFTGHALDGTYGNLCTGELEYTRPTDINELNQVCENAVKSLEIINMGSLGKILPPKRKNKFWTIMATLRPDTIGSIVDELIAEGCIKALL